MQCEIDVRRDLRRSVRGIEQGNCSSQEADRAHELLPTGCFAVAARTGGELVDASFIRHLNAIPFGRDTGPAAGFSKDPDRTAGPVPHLDSPASSRMKLFNGPGLTPSE